VRSPSVANYEGFSSSALEVAEPLLYLDKVVPRKDLLDESNRNSISETAFRNGATAIEHAGESPVVFPKILHVETEHFMALQSWEGTVQERQVDSFIAHLKDKSGDRNGYIAEISFEETSETDRDLIRPGAIFYWDIGYTEEKSGKRSRRSLIHFRRLPVWTPREISQIEAEAENIRTSIGWE
jgi:hypothetical protein